MFIQVSKPALATWFLLRTYMIPHTHTNDGRVSIFMNDDTQAVLQGELFVRDQPLRISWQYAKQDNSPDQQCPDGFHLISNGSALRYQTRFVIFLE